MTQEIFSWVWLSIVSLRRQTTEIGVSFDRVRTSRCLLFTNSSCTVFNQRTWGSSLESNQLQLHPGEPITEKRCGGSDRNWVVGASQVGKSMLESPKVCGTMAHGTRRVSDV